MPTALPPEVKAALSHYGVSAVRADAPEAPLTSTETCGVVIQVKGERPRLTRDTLRRLLRSALAGSLVLAALTALIGVLHLPFARPVLAKLPTLPFADACPVSRDPHAIAAVRAEAVRWNGATQPAASLAVLGGRFELEKTTRHDVDAWVSQHHLVCKPMLGATVYTCADVAANALGLGGARDNERPLVQEVTFTFAPNTDARPTGADTLRSINVYAFGLSADEAQRYLEQAETTLQGVFGPPHTAARGNLAARTGATTTLNYRFTNLNADVTATALPTGVAFAQSFVASGR
jgi:hypothetical protein